MDTTEQNAGHATRVPPRSIACRANYWLRVVLVVVAVAQRRCTSEARPEFVGHNLHDCRALPPCCHR
jgi:hypothetical protein